MATVQTQDNVNIRVQSGGPDEVEISVEYEDKSAKVVSTMDLGAVLRLQEELAYALRMAAGNPGRRTV